MNDDDYKCSVCDKRDVKLWRQYQTFSENIKLLCMDCAALDQNKNVDEIDISRCDQIGWLVPAIPTKDNSFWGYSSVPQEGCDWWHSLKV